MPTPLLEMRNISKRFGHIQVLKDVSLTVNSREVVALVGDNGAGKSTLIKILTGVYKKDSGEIYWKGKKVEISSPLDAKALGIEVVHQYGALIDGMNVVENFFLGREIVKSYGPIKLLDEKKMMEICSKVLRELGLNIDSMKRDVATLSGGERQGIAIGRCIYFGGELIVLDEPTTFLSIKETEKVLTYIRNAKKMGKSVIVVSHIIRDIYPIADRFVILHKGMKIADLQSGEITREELETAIVSGKLP